MDIVSDPLLFPLLPFYEMGGWAAGAVDGEVGIAVSVSGKNAKEDTAVALLQETIKRRRP